ncbi:MAG: hypothetical protein DRP85_09100 [Candidatus Makaraimicrobium thalassicum]|nr:MAG: hypothetical protein DRP85_09100 [Candidatus Omnitrophota bacterium]
MKDISKFIGKLLFYAMAIALSVYAASRTLDFVSGTLPADKQMIGYLALFATTGGALAWLMVFLNNSEGIGQKGIALLMVVVDLVGEFAIFTVETIRGASQSGMVTTINPEQVQTTIIGMSVLIAANILAIFAYHILDVENMEALELSLADAVVKSEILKAKKAKAKSLAKTIADAEADKFGEEQLALDRSDPETESELMSKVKGLFGQDAEVAPEKQEYEASTEEVGLVHAYRPGHENKAFCGIKDPKHTTYLKDEVTCHKCNQILESEKVTPADDVAEKEQAEAETFHDTEVIQQTQNGGKDGGYIPVE